MRSVLVTGASGFIGGHLVPALAKRGHRVLAPELAELDVCVPADWARIEPVDVVVHLAGLSFVPASWTAPARFVDVNVTGVVAALEYCRRHGARLVFPSSYLYGAAATMPIPETAPVHPTNPYALSKYLAEEVCRFYRDIFALDIVVLRPFNVYGPGQPEHFLLQTIIAQTFASDAVRVKDLAPRRDFVYIADLTDAMVRSVEADGVGGVYNIGSGVSYSVAEVIAHIQQTRGTTLPIECSDERRAGEIMDTVADVTRARQVLGWTPKWSLADGIRATVAAAEVRARLSGQRSAT